MHQNSANLHHLDIRKASLFTENIIRGALPCHLVKLLAKWTISKQEEPSGARPELSHFPDLLPNNFLQPPSLNPTPSCQTSFEKRGLFGYAACRCLPRCWRGSPETFSSSPHFSELMFNSDLQLSNRAHAAPTSVSTEMSARVKVPCLSTGPFGACVFVACL